MCINVYKIILLVCICCVGTFWISCSGNSDDSEQTEVILSVNKNTLIADGKDVITFTVMHAGIDVTADAIIITKITAAPIPAAVSVFFDTPRNGHNPKN